MKIAISNARKILISGAFATGKTILTNELKTSISSRGNSSSILREIPRRCPFLLNRDQTLLTSAWLIGEQIKSEIESLVDEDNLLICDRGIPDILSHTLIINIKSNSDYLMLERLINICFAWASTYDLVFWAKLDPNLPIQNDGLRVVEKTYQKKLEDSIEKSFHRLGIKVIELPRNLEDRIIVILDNLKSTVNT